MDSRTVSDTTKPSYAELALMLGRRDSALVVLQTTARNLQQQRDALDLRLSESMDQLGKLIAAFDKEKPLRAKVLADNMLLKDELQEAKASIVALTRVAKKQTSRIDTLSTELSGYKKTAREAAKENEGLKEKLAEMEKAADELKKSLRAESAVKSPRIMKLEGLQQSYGFGMWEELDVRQAQISTLTQTLLQYQGQVGEQQAHIAMLKQMLFQKDQESAAYLQQIKVLQASLMQAACRQFYPMMPAAPMAAALFIAPPVQKSSIEPEMPSPFCPNE